MTVIAIQADPRPCRWVEGPWAVAWQGTKHDRHGKHACMGCCRHGIVGWHGDFLCREPGASALWGRRGAKS